MFSSFVDKLLKNNSTRDTSLQLNCLSYGRPEISRVEKGRPEGVPCIYGNAPDDGCRLVLGLGPAPGTHSDDFSTSRGNKSKGLSTGHDSILKLGLSGGTDEVSSVLEFSTSTDCASDQLSPVDNGNCNRLVIPALEEGSTTGKKSYGYLSNFSLAPRLEKENTDMTESSNYSMMSIMTETANPTVSSQSRAHNMKRCKFVGCTKGARGATGLCISHGGGQRCQKPGCNKGAESKTVYCKSHGGGNRCQHLGCTKSAEGKTDFCIAHGGGKRCGHPEGCTKAARGKSGLCIRHGGGKRCKMDGCTRSAEGQIGLCISHGGGRRCQFLGCTKGAQGSTMFCKAHGGGKRCTFIGCTKGAEGSTSLCKGHGGGKRCLFNGGGICPKSVHGGTNFCVAHGGGKRCAVSGCTKSARGRTDCCVKHGGGKRCKFVNCDKSAQGSTEFCKAHGGGKRCNWSDGKCEKFARGKGGLCAAHSSLVRAHGSMIMTMNGHTLRRGLFHGVVDPLDKRALSDGVSVLSESSDSFDNRPAKRRQLIPPQVLVPLSMRASSSSVGGNVFDNLVGPEGRVHGGALMSLLGGGLKNRINGV